MKKRPKARQLQLIAIDDEASEIYPYDHVHVSHYSQFQDILNAVQFADQISGDLFIIDINMERMGLLSDLKWANSIAKTDASTSKPDLGAGVPLLGAILALPFLRSGRPAAFYPVSNYWGQVSSTDGPFIASLAILLSAMEPRIYSLSDAQTWLTELSTSKRADSNLRNKRAIKPLMERYRNSIEEHGQKGLRLLGVQSAIEQLSQIQGRFGKVESSLESDDGPIAIGLEFSTGEVDWIELRSLFADLFGKDYSEEAFLHPEQLRTLTKTLHLWKVISADRDGTLFNAVCNLLKCCEDDASAGDPRDIKEIMQSRRDLWEGRDEFQIYRLAMLFAWVYAASLQYPQIYARNDPLRAFEKESLRDRVYSKLGIHADDRRARYLQLLTTNNEISSAKYRTPFVRQDIYEGSNSRLVSAYSLGRQHRNGQVEFLKQDETELTDDEVNLCRDYAREELNWKDTPTARWPEWLKRHLE